MSRSSFATLAALMVGLGTAAAQSPQSYGPPSSTAYPAGACTTPSCVPSPPSSGYGTPLGYYATPSPVSVPPGCSYSVKEEGGTVRLLVQGNDGLRFPLRKDNAAAQRGSVGGPRH